MTASQRHYIYLGDRGNEHGWQEHQTPKVQVPLRSQDTHLDPNVEKEKFQSRRGCGVRVLPHQIHISQDGRVRQTLLLEISLFLPQTGQTAQQQKETQTKDVSCLLQWRKGKSQQVPLKHAGSVAVSQQLCLRHLLPCLPVSLCLLPAGATGSVFLSIAFWSLLGAMSPWLKKFSFIHDVWCLFFLPSKFFP